MRAQSSAVVCVMTVLGMTCGLHAQDTTKSIWDGVYSSAQADRGKELFLENCAKCHQNTLEGMDVIPPLKGSHFMSDWASQSVAELVNRVHTTMPMDDPGKLSTKSATDVVAFLLQQNDSPVGKTDLPTDPGIQGQILIEMAK